MYRGLIRPCMEYGFHVWGNSTYTALLNRLESKSFLPDQLSSSNWLSWFFKSPKQCCIFIYLLSLFSCWLLFWILPPLLPRPRCTRLSTSSHPYSVHLPNAKVNQYLHSLIPYTGKLKNSLPLFVFPPVYDLNSFIRGVSRHLSYQIGLPSHVYISPTVLFTGSGDKRNIFL